MGHISRFTQSFGSEKKYLVQILTHEEEFFQKNEKNWLKWLKKQTFTKNIDLVDTCQM